MAETTETTVVDAGAATAVADPKTAAAPDVESLNKRIAGQGRTIQELLDATGAKNVEEAKRMLKEQRKAAEAKPAADAEPVRDEAEPELPDEDDPKFTDADGNFKKAEYRRATAEATRRIAQWDREQAQAKDNEAAVDKHVVAEYAKLPEDWRADAKNWKGEEHPLARMVRGFAYDANEGNPPTAEQVVAAREFIQNWLGELIEARAVAKIATQDALAAENAAERPAHPGPAKPGTTKVESEETKLKPDMSGDELQRALRAKMKASRPAE